MHHRPLRRAIALSLGALLAFTGVAAADTVRADGDVMTTVIDATAILGAVAPGSVHDVDIGFVLTCANGSHIDSGQTVTVTYAGANEPEDGKILSVTDGTVGPAPATWPADGGSCASPAQTFSGGTPSVVTLRAPTTPGKGYRYSLLFDRWITPDGGNDGGALTLSTAIDIVLDVNTPPTLTLPTLAAVGTVEGNMIGGWVGPWLGLAATDAEDDPDPTPSCTPTAGTLLPLGPTSVTCSVTDSGDLTTGATFTLTVVDTTAPALLSVPGDYSVTTNDPTGMTLLYGTPSAMDVVDSHPVVGCLPANGTHVDVGTTTVTCTATDASGNAAQDSFHVTVTFVSPHVATAIWGEPVAGAGTTFTANRGRNIPIKVELFVDGVARTNGDAELLLSPCATGSGIRLALVPGNGRWNVGLDTSALDGSCYTVTATIDGLEAGSFRLELRGADAMRTNKGKG
jgi:hypothetical protein